LFLLSNTGMLLSPISGRAYLSSVFLFIFLKMFQKSLALFVVLNSLTNLLLQVYLCFMFGLFKVIFCYA
jgi:hypothetical protein